MIQTARSYGGMVTAPHHLAAQAGLRVLNDGGNAIEAMIAAASTIAVVYPHMNALGGDNFWLVGAPGEPPVGIDACGGAAGLADIGFYKSQDFDLIPERGPLSAVTVAGAVSGWAEAFELSRESWEGRLPLADCWRTRFITLRMVLRSPGRLLGTAEPNSISSRMCRGLPRHS